MTIMATLNVRLVNIHEFQIHTCAVEVRFWDVNTLRSEKPADNLQTTFPMLLFWHFAILWLAIWYPVAITLVSSLQFTATHLKTGCQQMNFADTQPSNKLQSLDEMIIHVLQEIVPRRFGSGFWEDLTYQILEVTRRFIGRGILFVGGGGGGGYSGGHGSGYNGSGAESACKQKKIMKLLSCTNDTANCASDDSNATTKTIPHIYKIAGDNVGHWR